MPPREVTLTFRGRDMMSPVLRTIGQGFNSLNDTATATLNGLKKLDEGFNNLSQAMNTTFMGVSAQAVIDFGIEMTNLGRTVIRTSNTFEQLAGAIDDPTRILQQLRDASFGAADDLTLMTGASRLMMMGLATTGDQLARITTLAIALKRPTQDAAGAFDDFGALLANNSIPRLDNFGISSAAVRLRIKELMSSVEGMDRSTAFMTATLEEGEKTLARLGNTVEGNVTSIDRWETAWTNAINNVANNIAQGVIGIGTGLELLAGMHPAQLAGQAQEMEILGETAALAFERGMITQAPGITENFLANVLRVFNENKGTIFERAASDIALGLASAPGSTVDPTIIAEYANRFNFITKEQEALRDIVLIRRVMTREAEEEAAAQKAITEEQARQLAISDEQAAAAERRQDATGLFQTQLALQSQFAELSAAFPLDFSGALQLPEFMTREQADRFDRVAQNAFILRNHMEAVEAVGDETIFAEGVLDNVTNLVDKTSELATEADKAATAFENIKLTEVFGQGRGEGAAGLVGDMTAGILEAAKAAGATADGLERVQRALTLASGAETIGSLGVAGPVSERLAAISLQDEDLGAMAALNVGEALRLAVELDIDPNTEEFIKFLTEQATGVSGGGGPTMTVEVKAGDTLTSLAGATGFSIDELMQAAGITDPRALQPGAFDIGAGGGDFQAVMGFDIAGATAAFGESGTIPTGLGDVLDTSTEVAIAWMDMQTAGEAFAAATQIADMSSAAILGSLSETFPLVKEINENMQPLAGSIENAVGHALNLANEFLPVRDHVLKVFNTLGLMNGKTTKHDIILNVKLTGGGQGGLALTPAKGIEETTAPGTP